MPDGAKASKHIEADGPKRSFPYWDEWYAFRETVSFLLTFVKFGIGFVIDMNWYWFNKLEPGCDWSSNSDLKAWSFRV